MMPHTKSQFFCHQLAIFGRFSVVGAITAAVYIGGFAGLIELRADTVTATVLSYLAAISLQFAGHWKFTFPTSSDLKATICRFLVANGLGLMVSTILAVTLTDGLALNALITGIIVTLVLASMNWVVFRNWVFKT